MTEILHLEGDFLQINGATNVVASTNSQAVVQCGEKMFVLSGNQIEVKKLNLEEGEVAFCGKFANIKVSHGQEKKTPIFKRIFK